MSHVKRTNPTKNPRGVGHRNELAFQHGALADPSRRRRKLPPKCQVCTSFLGVDDTGLCRDCRVLAATDFPPCGTWAGYGSGCRCQECLAANHDYGTQYRAKSKVS